MSNPWKGIPVPGVVILHNPQCSKSREALALLEARGITPRVVAYLETPPTMAELDAIVKQLGIGPRSIMRRDEPEYTSLHLDDPDLAHDDLLAAMRAHPNLIQRPIVIANGRAVLGRPPEAVLSIL
jgi:arsenate reductase